MLHDHGISTWGSFVFGFDTDDKEVFDRTVEFGIEMKLTMALYAILTPYPGTRLYRRLKAEGRLTDERWWLGGDHDAGSPYFVPARHDAASELREGWVRAWQRFYSPRSIWKRWTVTQALELDPDARLPAAQRHAEPPGAATRSLGGKQRFRSDTEAGEPVPDDLLAALEAHEATPDSRVLPIAEPRGRGREASAQGPR